jgi:hypothetical protein
MVGKLSTGEVDRWPSWSCRRGNLKQGLDLVPDWYPDAIFMSFRSRRLIQAGSQWEA